MAEEVKKDAAEASTQEGADETKTLTEAEQIAELATALKESMDREEKTSKDRDIYRDGLLNLKGKDSKTEEKKEEEGAAEIKTTDTSSELVGIVKMLLERNSELATAASNRSQIATVGQGGSSEAKVEVSDNLLSAAQLADLKARGWDDTKIALFKKNLKK